MALTPEDLAAIRRELEAVLDRRLGRDTRNIHPSPERCLRVELAQVLVRLGAVYEGEVDVAAPPVDG